MDCKENDANITNDSLNETEEVPEVIGEEEDKPEENEDKNDYEVESTQIADNEETKEDDLINESEHVFIPYREEKLPEKDSLEEKRIRILFIVLIAVMVLLIGVVFFTFEKLGVTSCTGINQSEKKTEKEPEEIKPPENKKNDGNVEEDIIKEIVTEGLTEFKADVLDIPVGKETVVTFTTRLEAEQIPEDCKFFVYPVGTDEFICELNDNGENGDETAGDKIYSAQVNLSSKKINTVEYIARATDEEAIKGSNRLKLYFYKNITDKEFKNFEKLKKKLWKMDFDKAKNYVISSDEITKCTINDKNHSIVFTTSYGITCVWEEKKEKKYEGNETETEITETTLLPAISKTNIAVIRPFKDNGRDYDDFKYMAEYLKTAFSGEPEVVDNDAVTLEFMKSLNNYGVVLIDSDGICVKNETPYIILGEKYSKNPALSADFQAGRICIVDNRYAINGEFFEKYYEEGDLDESLWFIGSSYSTYNQFITNALLSKGAEAVVGANDELPQKYCNEILSDFIVNGLLAGDTAENSLINAKKNYKEKYPDEETTDSLEFKGDSNFSLMKQEEIEEVSEEAPEKPAPVEVKKEKKSYLWLILLIIFIVIAAGAIVFWFIIMPKYKSKKWQTKKKLTKTQKQTQKLLK